MSLDPSMSSPNLGPTLSEHRVTATRAKGNYYAGIALVVFGVGGILAGVALSGEDSSLLFLCGGLGLLVALAGAYSVWQSRTEQNLAICTYRDGITYSYRGKTQTMRWDDIEQVWMGILNNVRLRTIDYSYRIKNNSGEQINFNYNDRAMQNMQQLSDTIQREVTSRLLPKAINAYNAGNNVTFGLLTVSQNGLGNGKETIPWGEVEEVKLQNGVVTVRKKDKWLNWSSVTVGGTPNIYVFLRLVDGIVGVNRQK